MPTAEKVKAVGELAQRLKEADAVVLTEFRGLKVAQASAFRAQLRAEGLEFKVVKNTLLRRAAQDAGIEGLDPYLTGTTALVLGTGDVVAPAKALYAFLKDNKELTVKAGVLEGAVIAADRVEALAKLPSRDELLGKVVSAMNAPLANMAMVLNAPLQNMAFGLSALRAKKEEEAA